MKEPPAAAAPPSLRPIVLLSLAAFASSATLRVADPLIPEIAAEFGVSAGGAAFVATTLFALAYGGSQIFVGVLGDRFGKYAVVAAACFLCVLGTAGAAFAGSLRALGAMRLVSGAAAGAIIPLGMAYLGDAVPYERRQPVLARYLSGQILGIIGGQALGGVFGEFVGWRGVFVALAALYLAIGVLLWTEHRSPRVEKRRLPGSGAFGLLARYLLLLRDARVRRVVVTAFAEASFFFGGFVYIGAYLRARFLLSYLAVGIVLAGFGLGGLVYALGVKSFVGRLGERGLVLAGGTTLAVALALAPAAPTGWSMAPLTVLMGTGFYMLHNTLQMHATQMAPQMRGMAIALFALCYFFGQATGVALFGILADRFGYPVIFPVAGAALLLIALAYRRAAWPAGTLTLPPAPSAGAADRTPSRRS